MSNLTNFWDNEKIAKNKTQISKIFFYRICGMGMGACAKLFKEASYQVEGADSEFFPPMSQYLKDTGIKCFELDQVDHDFLKNYDLIVVGNSVGKNSNDAKLIETSGVPFTSFPCLLGELILKNRKVIGIAGTHGKTTTSYYMAQILDALGADSGHFIGGVLPDRAPASLGKEGSYFIIESDEYDSAYFQKFSKFRQYQIRDLVLTSLEFDHADIFPSIKDIINQFEYVIPQIQKLTCNISYSAIAELVSYTEKINPSLDINFFGDEQKYGPSNLSWDGQFTQFQLNFRGEKRIFKSNVNGVQNILNISACIMYLEDSAFSTEEIQTSLLKLNGVKRRQELRGKYNKSIVIDDFAHHPTSMELTIDCIREKYPNKKCFVVFEPVTSTARSNAFQKKFSQVFNHADYVLIANPQINTNAKQYNNLDYDQLAKDITSEGTEAKAVKELPELIKSIDQLSQEDSILLVCSNRTVLGLWKSEFVNKIE